MSRPGMPRSPSRPGWWHGPSGLRPALLVCLAAALPYAITIDNYFAQDDFGVVWLLSHKPWWYFPRWFASTWMDDIWGYTPDEIRPFPAVTYQVAAVFGAASPVANHVINISFHAVNGVLVLGIARAAAGLSAGAALVAALVFVLLPFHAESVAWITGRVDSMPACFYFASFLLYVSWRASPDRSRLYWGSLAMFFAALFTKQNTITLGPALVLYDLVGVRRGSRSAERDAQPAPRVGWSSVAPYLPFAVLTLGYLALRYALFGEVARESQLRTAHVGSFVELVSRHLRRTLFGGPQSASSGEWLVVAAVLIACVMWAVRGSRARADRAARVAIYFGPVWWGLGVLPVLVAGYESPRHIYLAAAGWAILVGLAYELVPKQRRAWGAAAAIAAAAVMAAYAVPLARTLQQWEDWSRVSELAVRDLEREALAAPEGTLIIAGAPVRSWEWALPFITRSPFVDGAIERRVAVITPQKLHCCRAQWNERTRSVLREWIDAGRRAPIVALRWDVATGRRFRLSSDEEPYLRPLLDVLLQTDNELSLDRGLLDLLDRLPRDVSDEPPKR